MEPIHLNLRDVLPLTRKAYNEGRLQAQLVNRHERDGYSIVQACTYAGPCAIGVALTLEVAKVLDTSGATAISCLIDDGHIVVPDDQKEDFRSLQSDHDSWYGACPPENITAYEQRFLETLVWMEQKWPPA